MSRMPKFNTPEVIAELQADVLRVKLRMERVKLRKLEWDMSRYALPHITPLPGDNEVQVRIPPKPELKPELQPEPQPEPQPDPQPDPQPEPTPRTVEETLKHAQAALDTYNANRAAGSRAY